MNSRGENNRCLPTAAVFADAAHIVEEIVLLKTRVTAAAAADPTE